MDAQRFALFLTIVLAFVLAYLVIGFIIRWRRKELEQGYLISDDEINRSYTDDEIRNVLYYPTCIQSLTPINKEDTQKLHVRVPVYLQDVIVGVVCVPIKPEAPEKNKYMIEFEISTPKHPYTFGFVIPENVFDELKFNEGVAVGIDRAKSDKGKD